MNSCKICNRKFIPTPHSLGKYCSVRCSGLSKRSLVSLKQRMRNRRMELKRVVDELKNRPCCDCEGWFEPCQMDYDHRISRTKVGNIASMRSKGQNRLQYVLKEIAKCDLVCANCHRLRTQQRRKYGVFIGGFSNGTVSK